MPRLVIDQKEFLKILKSNNFYFKRQEGSHQAWEGFVNGKRMVVSVDKKFDTYNGWLLNSMIRQSGLPKRIFRK